MISNKTWAEIPGLSEDLKLEKDTIFAICGDDPKFFNSVIITFYVIVNFNFKKSICYNNYYD